MTVTYEDLIEASGGEMCGGDVLARIDGKTVVLGRKRGAVFNLTPAGEEFVSTMTQEAKPAKQPKEPKPAKAKSAEGGQEIKVDLASNAALDDMLG